MQTKVMKCHIDIICFFVDILTNKTWPQKSKNMARGLATDKKVREIIILQYARGKSMKKIATDLSLAKSTVGDIIKKYGESGDVNVRGKSPGRPRIITERIKRNLVKICKSRRRATLRDVLATWNDESGINVSRECCRQWIHKSGLGFYKAKEKPFLTAAQKKKRLDWAKSKVDWSKDDWKKVIFSDESKFEVCIGDSRKRIIRDKSEAFHKDCLKRTVKFPQGVMIWGCMSAKGTGQLEFIDGKVTAQKYQEILERNLIPTASVQFENQNYIFQQDGASCHTAKTTKKWFGDNDINVFAWPANSPDLNVIETLWHVMKRSLRDRPQRTIPDLKCKIQQIWDSYTPEYCQSLTDTMPSRIQAVIKAKGDVTPY